MGFFKELLFKGDMDFLGHQTLEEKFFGIVSSLNNYAFGGNGSVSYLDKRSFNLYQHDSNQIIQFYYQMNELTITWRFKYYQKEVVHKKTFTPVKNLSIFEQGKIVNRMTSEMEEVVEKHKKDVFKF